MPASPDRLAAAPPVRGRFAPSPSGPLHFGSLVAALASYLDARSRAGKWLVRIDDLDPPRAVPGTADLILRTLEAFGFECDGAIRYQSRRQARYAAALERLARDGAAYACTCSRSEIARTAARGIDGPIYPGTCRDGIAPGRAPRAFRVRAHDADIVFVDELQGPQRQNVARAVGDFVLRRADGLFAYQLAVVVDDFDQGITRVVRGADLLDSSARQIMLQRLLGFPPPAYLHVPVAVDAAGDKLSKQTLAKPLDVRHAGTALAAALDFLQQPLPPELIPAPPREMLHWACRHWRAQRIAPALQRIAPPDQR